MKKYKSLFLLSGFCIILVAFRVIWQQHFIFSFLFWNLFLAWLPLLFLNNLSNEKWSLKNLILIGLTLVFLPNSAYLITDMVHLRHSLHSPTFWYDLVMLFSFSLAGCLINFIVINRLKLFLANFPSRNIQILALSAIYLSVGYGIYLGRVERYNSWDALLHPLAFCSDMIHLIFSQDAFYIIGFTTLFAIFIAVLDYVFHSISANNE
ncbi:MAG: DUF1361 domain-containing protein [Flavobacteriales bacterium]|nr:DUF1361 domain-containing protein [Flavobacteriales bacterium]